MTTELNHIRTGNTLRNAQSGLPSGLYQILIPAGTHLWRTGVQTYLSDEPASALASFDAPPTGPGELLEAFRSFKGAMKVLEWIGKAAKPLGYVVGLGASVAAFWAAMKSGINPK